MSSESLAAATRCESRQSVIQRLEAENPDAVLIDEFEEALIGVRCGGASPSAAAYDYCRCIDILCQRMEYWEAVVHLYKALVSADRTQSSPLFLTISP
jgi:hypothetical protein